MPCTPSGIGQEAGVRAATSRGEWGGEGQREVSEAECSDNKNLSALPTPLLTIMQGPGAEGLRRM